MPGKIVIHQAPEKKYSWPARIKDPRDGIVTGIPRPKKDRAASLMIALATWIVEMTMTDVREFGKI